jgi:hypothetical protein
MPVDHSVYGMFRPADLGGAMVEGIQAGGEIRKLKDMARQRKREEDTRDAFTKALSPDGTVNQQGLSALAAVDPEKAFALKGAMGDQAAKAQKAQQEQREQFAKAIPIVGGAMESLFKMTPEQRAAQFPVIQSRLVKSGYLDPSRAADKFDENEFQEDWKQLQSTKEWQDVQKTRAETEKLRREASGKGELSHSQQLAMWRLEDQRNDRKEKAVGKLAENLGSSQEVGAALAAVENKLGFNLDDWDTETQQAAVMGDDGKPTLKGVDLPGVSIPLIGRVSAHSGKARELESSVAKVFNTELKTRSGAAVTSPELERLKIEFGSGKYNTEAEMIGALKEYKAAARIAMQNIERGAPQEALAEYQERGGMTSAALQGGDKLRTAKASAPQGRDKNSAYANDSAPKGPRHGHVEAGYVFMGGDPGDQKNWKKER